MVTHPYIEAAFLIRKARELVMAQADDSFVFGMCQDLEADAIALQRRVA